MTVNFGASLDAIKELLTQLCRCSTMFLMCEFNFPKIRLPESNMTSGMMHKNRNQAKPLLDFTMLLVMQ